MKAINRVVGLFVILSLIGVSVAVILLGINQRWFRQDYRFYTLFRSGGGLETGMPVTLKGFEIGKVDSFTFLADTRQVRLDFHIYDTYYFDVVLENSVIEHAESPIGIGGGLFFHPGKVQDPPKPPLEEESYIVALDSKEGRELLRRGLVDREGGDDTIGAILSKIGPILENVNNLLFNAQELTLALEDAVEGDRESQLGALLYSIDELVSSVDRIISGRDTGPMGDILVNVRDSTDTLTYAIDRTSAEATLLLSDLQKLAANIERLTADPSGILPTLVGPEGSSIRSLLEDDGVIYGQVLTMTESLTRTLLELENFAQFVSQSTPQISAILGQAEDVLEGLSNNPLLRGGITEQKVQEPIFDSSRDGAF